MANGTGLITDSEVVKGSQAEPDTEEVIDWKTEKAVEEARLTKLTIRLDLLRKLSPKTEEGKHDVQNEEKRLLAEIQLVREKIDFYKNCIQHAYERQSIRRIFGR